MHGTLVFYLDNEELKNAAKNLLQRLMEGKEQPPFVDNLSLLKKGEYQIGAQENETVFTLFYSTNHKYFVDYIYRFLLHFFPTELIDMCNFEHENREDSCCFLIFFKFNEFPFHDVSNREQMCEWMDNHFLEIELNKIQ